MPIPAPQTVSLGTFAFDELQFEVPQDLEIHKRTLGGSAEIPQAPGSPAQVVTQTFGVVVDPIKIDAWFIGPNAMDNARKMEGIQLAQTPVSFVFGALSWQVTVMAFNKRFRSTKEIGYTLELTPQIETSHAAQATTGPSASSSLSTTTNSIANYPQPPI